MKRIFLAMMWLGAFSGAVWGYAHSDDVFTYVNSLPTALTQILNSLIIVVIYGVVTYIAWKNLTRRSFTCSQCGGSGERIRINLKYNYEERYTCPGCGGRGQVFGFLQRTVAAAAIGLAFVFLILSLNVVFKGVFNGVISN